MDTRQEERLARFRELSKRIELALREASESAARRSEALRAINEISPIKFVSRPNSPHTAPGTLPRRMEAAMREAVDAAIKRSEALRALNTPKQNRAAEPKP